jgi:MFS transporter, DHA3 family, macrolide efflux protein
MLQFLRGNPLFLRYWISTWFSEFGDWLRNMTLMFLVLDLSNHSSVAVSTTLFFEFAPIFLFGTFVGVFADRWNRKKTIIYSNVARAVLVLIFVLALLFHSIILIYIGAFVCAIATLFYRAPASAFVMQFVPEQDRKMAASLRQLSVSTMLVIGAGLGTTIYFWLGAIWSLLIIVISFVISAFLVYTLRLPQTEEASLKKDSKGIRVVWGEMIEGFHFSWRNPTVRALLFSFVPYGVGAGIVNVSTIFVITEYLGLKEEVYGWIVVIQGAGMLFFSLIIGKIKLANTRLVSYGMIIMGVGLAGSVFYPHFLVTSAFIVFFCAGQIAFNVGTATLMQTKVEYAYQGRAGMTLNTTFMGSLVVTMLFTGWLHELLTIQPLMLLGGTTIFIGGIVCTIIFKRNANNELKQLQVSEALET